MNITEKIRYVKNFFKGERRELHPMWYKEPKQLICYDNKPGIYQDLNNRSICYKEEDIESLSKEFFLMIITIVTKRQDEEIDD